MKTIAIDFDGVLHEYSKGWNGGKIERPEPGAKEALITLCKKYDVVILTARTDLEPVAKWMTAQFPEVIDQITITNVKPAAAIYIDDRALRFFNWPQALCAVDMRMERDQWLSLK